MSNYLFLSAHVKKGVKVPKPTPTPRPDTVDAAPARRQSTRQELARFAKGRARYSPRKVS